MTSYTDEKGSGVYIQFPLPQQRLFRNQATQDILLLFLRNPHQEFTVTEIRNTTEHGGDTIQTALNVLEAADLIQTQRKGRKKLIKANRTRYHNPDDPLLSIPQEEFRTPVKAFLDQLDQTDVDVAGVILFGSVARGEADRASDIDIQIIVENDLLESRRTVQDIRQEIEEKRFDGNRYEFQVLVESVESAESYGEKLQEIFSEGIKLRETNELEQIQEAVFNG
ncbi:nucleotidyltransferase domain-containing protein [Halobellus rubicundus]|uniref:Nucleotidyltransferase domain-containing protein n=1 Tax=Halobellus rubicundus TaxID=2996466 RepID=A0ABD5MC33_9EURY